MASRRAAPDHLRTVLGWWWSEGYEPADRPPAVFEETGPDVLRTVCGREAGELLRLTRDPAGGEVVRMHWATYRFTRRQETFEGS